MPILNRQPKPQTILDTVLSLEPKAGVLLAEAVALGMAHPSFDNEAAFHADFKPRLARLVGFEASDQAPREICTSEAYAALYHAVLNALHCWGEFKRLSDVAALHGYKSGWAAIQFKIKFGVMPRFNAYRKFKTIPGGAQ